MLWVFAMYRRLYFLLPDREHTLAVVNDLVSNGVHEDHIHAVADQRVDLPGLPNTTTRQKQDTGRRVEKLLWNANLAAFSLALGSFITLIILYGLTGWLLLCIAVMVATFMAGLGFTHVPNTHLGEFHDAIAHGEILLMIDVEEARVTAIEDRVHHHHPEAAVGGVGWGTAAFGL